MTAPNDEFADDIFDARRRGHRSGADPTTQYSTSVSHPLTHSPADPGGAWVGPREEPTRYSLTSVETSGGGAEGSIFRAVYVGRGGGNPTPLAVKEYSIPAGAPARWPHDGTWLQINEQANLLRSLPETPHLVKVWEAFLGARSWAAIDIDPAGGRKAFDTPYLIMEWIEGSPPEELLNRGDVTLTQRLGWISDLAAAIDQLASLTQTFGNPLVHGDIKPSNCLIHPTRGLVLLDTGALHRAQRSGNHRGLMSPPYAAPEVRTDPHTPRTQATEYYSLGAVAYYFLTERRPPDSIRPGYFDEVQSNLRLGSWLDGRTEHEQARARAIVATMLSADPATRTATNARDWAAELAQVLAPRRTRRRRILAGAAVVILTATGTFLGTQFTGTAECAPKSAVASTPSNVPQAVATSAPVVSPPSPGSVVDWSSLPASGNTAGDVLYRQTFDEPRAEWAQTIGSGLEINWDCSALNIAVTDPVIRGTLNSPTTQSRSDEVVSATGTITGGQGGWGVWCRGTDSIGSQHYGFEISHAGAVRITDPALTAAGTDWTWVYLTGVDVAKPVTLSGRCTDARNGSIALVLAVNGREVLEYQPTIDVLGPGYAGVRAFAFGDVKGALLEVSLRNFEVSTPS